MNLKTKSYEYTCKHCGNSVNESYRYCQVCSEDAGTPNVRSCSCSENIDALNNRLDRQIEELRKHDKLEMYESLIQELKKKLSVIIAMPPRVARNLFDDPSSVYTNYETLTNSGVKTPSTQKNSAQRGAVASILFGDYRENIIYGALSIDNYGLSTYGSAHCKLKNEAINKRTTFLECNSYKFVEKNKLKPGDQIPLGYATNWEKKEILVLLKLSEYIIKNDDINDVLNEILFTDKKDRSNDEFVEAHIYGNFVSSSIDSVEYDGDGSRQDKLDMEILQTLLQ